MKELDQKKIDEITSKAKSLIDSKNSDEFINSQMNYETKDLFENQAVLGFDIYKYSRYPSAKQILIPHVFRQLYKQTVNQMLITEPYIYQNYSEELFTASFIDTGDGGFQIFDSPFPAIIFALYFQANIRRYNAGAHLQDLHCFVGEIVLRYSLTYDLTYKYENNFYGPSIINCSRIMAKDKLNRFLIDDNCIKWFTEHFNGIENLETIKLRIDFHHIPFFKNYKEIKGKQQSLLFGELQCRIHNVDVLSIGEIESKSEKLSIHSLYIKSLMTAQNGEEALPKYTVALGNLNTTGLTA